MKFPFGDENRKTSASVPVIDHPTCLAHQGCWSAWSAKGGSTRRVLRVRTRVLEYCNSQPASDKNNCKDFMHERRYHLVQRKVSATAAARRRCGSARSSTRPCASSARASTPRATAAWPRSCSTSCAQWRSGSTGKRRAGWRTRSCETTWCVRACVLCSIVRYVASTFASSSRACVRGSSGR